jgi:hypothetical protein
MYLAKASEVDQTRRRKVHDHRKVKPRSEVMPQAFAAAAVTVLMKHIEMKDALDEVSRVSGIDRTKLGNFRDHCVREAYVSEDVLSSYKQMLSMMEREGWSPEDIAATLPTIRALLANSPLQLPSRKRESVRANTSARRQRRGRPIPES